MVNTAKAPATMHFAFADALRAIAILLVVLSHIVMLMPFLNAIEPFRRAMGSLGVDAFFVLSGFLLGRPYVDAVLGAAPLPDWKRYARRRFLRIWPAYAAVISIAVVKSFGHHGFNAFIAADAATHLLMIHNFFPQFAGGIDNISLWTMAADAQFYVALPIVAWLLIRYRGRGDRTALLRTLGAIVIASFAYRIAAAFVLPNTVEYELSYERNLIGMGESFAAGVFLACLDSLGRTCRPSDAARFLAGSSALAIACFAISYFFAGNRFGDWLMDLTGTAAVALLIFAIRQVRWPMLDALLASRLVQTVAANAYALYLLHVPIKATVVPLLESRHFQPDTNAFGIVFLIAFCAVSAVVVPLLHRFVENPFLTLKERKRETSVAAA